MLVARVELVVCVDAAPYKWSEALVITRSVRVAAFVLRSSNPLACRSVTGNRAQVLSRDVDAPTKLRTPELPTGHLPRPVLVDMVARSSRLVSITAPAGYGKTTLLAEWARAEERPVGWVSLDAGDNDPVALMAEVASSFGQTQGFNGGFWQSMSSPGASILGRIAPRLGDALRSASNPFVLVLDDLHEVSAGDAHDVVDLLVGRVPAGSTLAVASRVDPPSLATWRVGMDVLEVGVEHLAFALEEALRFLESGRAGLSNDTVRKLHGEVEGWVAGLKLALAVARRGRVQDFGGSDRFVADYLRREVLDGLSDSDRAFLTRTSVLDELGGQVCDHLLGAEGSAARLEQFERANLFLVPLDRQRSRYRYHAAFRELLAAQLERAEGKAAVRCLHSRAAEWHVENAMPEQAIEHALRADDPQRAVELVTSAVRRMNTTGRSATVRRWFNALGEDAILGHPPLAVLAGWEAAMWGRPTEAERWLARIDGLSFHRVPADRSASFASARAMLRALLCPNGPAHMLEDAELALLAEPPWSEWRSVAEVLTAQALLLRGADTDVDRAWTLFCDAISSSKAAKTPGVEVIGRAGHAKLAMARGDWETARADVIEGLALIDQYEMPEHINSLGLYAAGASLALHDGDRGRAMDLTMLAMRSRGVATYAAPYLAVDLRVALIRVHMEVGDVGAARHLLHEIDDMLRRRPALGSLVDEVERIRHGLAAAPAGLGAFPLTPAELRVLPYLQTHLTFELVAERLHLSRNTVASHTRSIYRKLAVSSRADAVDVARAAGLLGDIGPTTAL